ncbi:MAG: peptidyl-prolyl cis-trans isomerase [Solirubrobacterales bacterium]
MNDPKARIAAVFGAVVIVAVVIAALTSGIGHADVPEGDVASVDGDGISQAQFDRALQQAALQQGVEDVPAPGDQQYDALRDQAMGDLLDVAWIQKEAEEQGVSVSDRQVQTQLEQTKKQNFKTDAEYQKFLETSGYTQEDVDLRIKLQLLSQMIQQKLTTDAPKVSDSEVEDFYNQNKAQFEQPETRDIRIVLTKDQAQADEAKKALEADNSDASWQKVAAEFSTDEASKDKGGVRAGVTAGVLEGDLDGQVFDAEQDTVLGPVQTPLGFYVFQVDKITPGGAQPLSAVQAQLKQQLQAQAQQESFSAFIEDYRAKWTSVTLCADGFVIDRCDNFVPGATMPCTASAQAGCPAPVLERSPLAPGAAGAGSLGGGGGGAPQRPHPPGAAQTPPGAPGAAGAGGAQSVPVTPGAAGGAGAAPTGAAPPGG